MSGRRAMCASPCSASFTRVWLRLSVGSRPGMEEKQIHYGIYFNSYNDLSEVAEIVRQSYDLYSRTFVSIHLKKYHDVNPQATPQILDDKMSKTFSYAGKMVSVNILGTSYVFYVDRDAVRDGRQLTL